MQYELKLQAGGAAVWEGRDSSDAIARYLDMHRDQTVVAWRHYPRHGVFVYGGARIIEPGEKGW